MATITPIMRDGKLHTIVAVATDITERMAAEQALRRLSAIVASSTDAIIGMDLAGRITSWNEGAVTVYGYSADEVLGRNIALVADETDPEEWRWVLDRWRAGERVEVEGFRARRKDGSIVEVYVVVSPIRDADGAIIGSAAIARDATERRRLERAAEEDRRRLAEAQEIARLGTFELDPATNAVAWSDAYRSLLGIGPEETASIEGFLTLVLAEDRDRCRSDIASSFARGDGSFEGTYRIVRSTGEVRWLQIRTRGLNDEDGNLRNVVGTALDVTERHRSEEARRDAEERFRLGFERGAVATAMVDLGGKITSVNPVFCALLGRSAEELIGHSSIEFTHPDDLPDTLPLQERLRAGRNDRMTFERRFVRPDGEEVWALINLALVHKDDGSPAYVYAQMQDITERKTAEEALEHLALHDPLTGLPNRLLLQDRLEGALARALRYGRRVAIVFGDIDRFKLVNDTLGHDAGDQLLVELAQRLDAATKPPDTVGRFGGDEFVLICEDVGANEPVEAIGRRMSGLFEAPFLVEGQDLYVTVSCGIVLADAGDTPATCLRNADMAMYRAKELGRARTELFDRQMHQRAARLLDLESALRLALDHGDLKLAYQPIVRLDGGGVAGVEALLRWDHPTRGEVPPKEFVGVAEQSGLIVPLGRWVVEEAVEQIVRWRRDLAGASELMVSINLSAQQLSPDLVALCEYLIHRSGERDAFAFEITESVIMADVDAAITVLQALRQLGIPVAIDDFGTGYSSLEYLQRLPVRALKIDASFIEGLGGDAHDPSIVRAVIGLAHALGMQTCAEGVETAQQLALLTSMGCHLGQGFFFAKPLSAEGFEEWYAAR